MVDGVFEGVVVARALGLLHPIEDVIGAGVRGVVGEGLKAGGVDHVGDGRRG